MKLPKYDYERKDEVVYIWVSPKGRSWRDVAARVRKIADCIIAVPDGKDVDDRLRALVGTKANQIPSSMSRQGGDKIQRRPRTKPADLERHCNDCNRTLAITHFQIRNKKLSGDLVSHYNGVCKECESLRLIKRSRALWLQTLSITELADELQKALLKAEHIREEIAKRSGHGTENTTASPEYPFPTDLSGCDG